jgi:predicted nucleic acid-binding protein
VQSGKIKLQEPAKPVDWFQSGENAAIALAMEHSYFLLIDDANPYHRAKAAGLNVVGSSELAILLYDHGHVTYDTAVIAIRQTHASKNQKRLALSALETLRRLKEN